MPIDRAVGVTTNGHSAIRVPGVYAEVLEQVVREEIADTAFWLTDESSDEAVRTEFERAEEARIAQEIEKRWGTTLFARSYQLPSELPPPFEQWPRGGSRRSFTVHPDDMIRVRSMGVWA